MKPTLTIKLEKNYTDTGMRGTMAHQPMLGDFLSINVKINGETVFLIIEGKTTNKYTGRYQSYTRVDKDASVDSIVNFIKKYENKNDILISKNNKALASQIFDIARYNENSFNIRKSGEFLGCKVISK